MQTVQTSNLRNGTNNFIRRSPFFLCVDWMPRGTRKPPLGPYYKTGSRGPKPFHRHHLNGANTIHVKCHTDKHLRIAFTPSNGRHHQVTFRAGSSQIATSNAPETVANILLLGPPGSGKTMMARR